MPSRNCPMCTAGKRTPSRVSWAFHGLLGNRPKETACQQSSIQNDGRPDAAGMISEYYIAAADARGTTVMGNGDAGRVADKAEALDMQGIRNRAAVSGP